VVGCAAPPVLGVKAVIEQAQMRGWNVCLILTPTAARWLQSDLPALERLTGHPVRSAYKLPGEPDVLPEPDAIVVAPATANTISKWAAGISDNLALGLITEAIGKRLRLVALPHYNAAQAAHPALPRSIGVLAGAGVDVLAGTGLAGAGLAGAGLAGAGLDGTGLAGTGEGGEPGGDFPWHRAIEALGR
jgi:hypothetical protein